MKGRQRHSGGDTPGVLLTVVVPAADIPDRAGGQRVVAGLKEALPTLRQRWVDRGYRGPWVDGGKETRGGRVLVGQPWWTGVSNVGVAPGQEPPELPAGFQVLPWRWSVERSFAWMGRDRRRSQDDEYLVETSEAMVDTAMSRTMLARLARLLP